MFEQAFSSEKEVFGGYEQISDLNRAYVYNMHSLHVFIVKCPFLLERSIPVHLLNSSRNTSEFINGLKKGVQLSHMWATTDYWDLNLGIKYKRYTIFDCYSTRA